MTDQIAIIPNGWEEKALAEAVEIIDGDRGVNYPQHNDFSSSGYCVFLNTKNIPSTKFDFSETSFISERKDEKLRKGKLERGDFVLTTRGTIGNYAYFSNSIPYENIRINSGMVIMRPKEEVLDRGFFNAYLASYFFHTQVKTLSSGTAQPQLPIRDLSIFKILLPSLPEQRMIAAVLSPLDNKIELLHEQNKTLEAIAKAIFREWFVSFDFPRQDEKPYNSNGGQMITSELGEIPEGWKVGKLEDIADAVLGGTPSTTKSEYWDNGTIPWINSGKVNDFRIYEPTAYITTKALDESAVKLMPKGTVVIAITGATLGQVSRLEIESTANQSVVGLIPHKKFFSAYLFYWMLKNISSIINVATGGAQQHINKNDVNSFELIIPTDDCLKMYFEIANPILEKISSNCFQIHTLSNLRDTILPKLMRGEMRVGKS